LQTSASGAENIEQHDDDEEKNEPKCDVATVAQDGPPTKNPEIAEMMCFISVYITRKAKASIAAKVRNEGFGTKSHRNMLIFNQTGCINNTILVKDTRMALE